MRHGSNPQRSRSQRRPSLNWRSVVSTELVYGVGLSVLAIALAWPSRSDGMRGLKSAPDASAKSWGRVQAVAVGTTSIFTSHRNAPHHAALAGLQDGTQGNESKRDVAVPDSAPHLLLPGVVLLPGVEVMKPIGRGGRDEASPRRAIGPQAAAEKAVPVPTQLVERQTPVVKAANQQVQPHQGSVSTVVNVGWFSENESAPPVIHAPASHTENVIASEQEQGREVHPPSTAHNASTEFAPIPESLLKLDPPSPEYFDEQAIAEIASVRERLGGSVLDLQNEDPSQSLDDPNQEELNSDGDSGFIELLRGVLKRSGDSIPWRPLNVRQAEDPEGATVMTPTIVFEAMQPDSEFNQPVGRSHPGEFSVTVAGYHETSRTSSPSSAGEGARSASARQTHLVQRLRDWSRELDDAAADAEDQGEYDRADSLRELAQEIRMEARGMASPDTSMVPENLPVRKVIHRAPDKMPVEPETIQRRVPQYGEPRARTPVDPVQVKTTETPAPWLPAPWLEVSRDPQQAERALRRLRRVWEIEAGQQAREAERE